MEDNSYIERIHRFLQNELSNEEVETFRSEMETDSKLKADVDLEKKLLAGIIGIGDRNLKSEIAGAHEKLRAEGFFDQAKESNESGGKVVGLSFSRILSIAAGLALAIGIGWWALTGSTPQTNAEIFAEYYQPEKTEIKDQIKRLTAIGMVGAESEDDRLRKALRSYEKGDFSQALSDLDRFLKDFPTNRTGRFYYALTLLHGDKTSPAFTILRELSMASDFELQDDAQWYQALALLKMQNNEDAAVALFNTIAGSDSKYRNQASSILSIFEHRE